MEVHHHPYVEKKRFKEYFLEFLMIFLAVTLGFFAENVRESISDHAREVSYMRGILSDLKADTSELRQLQSRQALLFKHFDAALAIPPQQLSNPVLQDSFYRHYIYFYSFTSYFDAHNRTISQLQNGNTLNVNRREVMDSISELNLYYDYYIRADNAYYTDIYEKTNENGAKVISTPPFMGLVSDAVPSVSHDLPIFITHDLAAIRELYNYINMEKGQVKQCMLAQEVYKIKAERLIAFISKKYHFDNE